LREDGYNCTLRYNNYDYQKRKEEVIENVKTKFGIVEEEPTFQPQKLCPNNR
jgi:hypothetical protein